MEDMPQYCEQLVGAPDKQSTIKQQAAVSANGIYDWTDLPELKVFLSANSRFHPDSIALVDSNFGDLEPAEESFNAASTPTSSGAQLATGRPNIASISQSQLTPEDPTVQPVTEHQNLGYGYRQPYECTLCKRRFTRSNNLRAHMRVHTSETPYKCTEPECEKAFKWRSSLAAHLDTHRKDYELQKYARSLGYNVEARTRKEPESE